MLAIADKRPFLRTLLIDGTLNPFVNGLGILVLIHDCFGDVQGNVNSDGGPHDGHFVGVNDLQEHLLLLL